MGSNSAIDEHAVEADGLEVVEAKYQRGYEADQNITLLTSAIQRHKQVLDLTPETHPDRTRRLLHLGIAHYKKYQRVGVLEDLEQATAHFQHALCLTSDDHPDRALVYEFYGTGLLAWHQRVECLMPKAKRISMMPDLESAIYHIKRAYEITDNSLSRASQLQKLGDAYKSVYHRTSEEFGIHWGLHCYQTALNIVPEDAEDRPSLLQSLGLGYHDRYKATDMTEDLSLAVLYFQQALDLTPENLPDQGVRLQCLGLAWQDTYRRSGLLEDLERGLGLLQRALHCTPDDHANRASLLQSLATAYGDRYKRTTAILDIDSAIQYDREALKLTEDDHPQRIHRLLNLGMRLGERFQRSGELRDIEKAIDQDLEADSLKPYDYPDPGAALQLLGIKYQDKYKMTSSMQDLDKAIHYFTEAVESFVYNPLHKANRLQTLGVGLHERYRRQQLPGDLATAVQYLQQALQLTPITSPDRASRLHCIGRAYQDNKDQKSAIEHFQEALAHSSSAPAGRFKAGRDLVEAYAEQKDWDRAYQAAVATVSLIPQLTHRSMKSLDKQHFTSGIVNLATDAAAIALNAGKGPMCALELLENGRVVLATSLQDMRIDISVLRKEYPELALSFLKLRNQLDPPSDKSSIVTAESSVAFPQPEADRRYTASNKMQALLIEIRRKPGFARFLLSPSEDAIMGAASDGPIIVINVSSHRCDAFLIERSRIRVKSLPRLSRLELCEREQHVQSLETLSWLWDVLVSPVLDTLGLQEPLSGHSWPRVWWIPTGPLVHFPLHAAGRHLESSFHATLDRVVSSYSPSIKAIVYGRQQQDRDVIAGLRKTVVLIAMQDTPQEKKLNYACEETSAVENICKSMSLSCIQPRPFKEEVSSALEACMVFHFAGHGGTRKENPLQSLLMLEDWKHNPLTLESLLETNLSSNPPFLAYLSACGTSQIQNEQSFDESVHLASAFLVAGFRHVVGTLCEVDDELCVHMATLIYEFLRNNGTNDRSVSDGLHHATQKLRDEWVQQQYGNQRQHSYASDYSGHRGVVRDIGTEEYMFPSMPLWVPYVHYGV